jgi:hypothetical protein
MSQGSSQFTRIEFRAWTGKKMIYQDNQYLGSFIRRVVPQIIWGHDETAGYREHESYLPNGSVIDEYLQQLTPFKDKNDKKVYIRDIIDCNYTWFDMPMHERHMVRMNDLGLILPFHQPLGHDGRLWIQCLAGKFEVIGNADENPEFLPEQEVNA